jgi:hypothetical protein
MRQLLVLTLLCLPAALAAQGSDHTISPGMTRAQVVAALGAPATQRTASEFTYMFYSNACGRECGMNDLVILRNDSVSDAIFRSPNRHYTGTSSSPEQAPPEAAPRRARPAPKPMAIPKSDSARTKPAAETKAASPTKMKPPAKANDATPSIPAKPKTLPTTPAKSTTPAKPPATEKKTPG